jgi:hypothetical protein
VEAVAVGLALIAGENVTNTAKIGVIDPLSYLNMPRQTPALVIRLSSYGWP